MVPEVGMSTFRKNEPVLTSEKRTVKCNSSLLRPLGARLTFDCKGILLVQSRVKHARRGESLGTRLSLVHSLAGQTVPAARGPARLASAVVLYCCVSDFFTILEVNCSRKSQNAPQSIYIFKSFLGGHALRPP